VHRLGYGAMQLTGPGVWGPPRDHAAAVAVVRRAVELGVDFIDTADSYGPYVSEEIIREALHPYPEQVVVATKAGLVRTGPGEWHPVGRPEYLRQEAEMSLRRLGLEQIPLFQLHRIDPQVPLEDQVGVLKALQDEGKVGQIGLSEVTVDEIEQAGKVAEIASVQNLYNLANRQSEEVLDYCDSRGIAFIPWFPIANGDLAQPGGPVDHVVQATGATPAQVALAWLLARSPVVLPIPGTSTVAHLEENVTAVELRLTDEQVAELTAAVTK
jgi:aryl-alcohol dehydrogenase-like predicted oxidoreductase